MKTVLIAICFLFALCTTALGQIYVGAHTYLPFQDTSKRIVSMRTTSYRAVMVNGKLVKKQKLKEVIYYYDKHGSLVKRFIVLPVNRSGLYSLAGHQINVAQHALGDSAVAYNHISYDAHGNITALQHDPMLYMLGGTFKYNDNNELVELKQYKSGSLDKLQTYQYNDHNKLTERDVLSPKGKLLTKVIFGYDKADRMIEIAAIDSMAHTTSRTKLIYDNRDGKLMHLVLITDNSEYPIQYDYEYDNHDRKTKIYVIYGNTKQLYSFFKYDSQGGGYQYTETNNDETIVQTISAGLKKREKFEGKLPRELQTWQYDKHNNVTQHTEAYYTRPPEKIELMELILVENDIKYRGGIFDRIELLLKKKVYPPRVGGK